jgi:hypothetical protein
MSTALDLIKGALINSSAYQPGDNISPNDQNRYLAVLNDLFDSWSTDKLHIFGTNENILQWSVNQNQYTVGNPTSSSLGLPDFTGTVSSGSAIVTGITNVPSQLVAGATITDTANVFPAGATVSVVGTNSVTMSANATATPNGTDSFVYTIPGNFAIARPLRITGGFTRINQLDFWLDVYASQAEYTQVLYKAQPGPWPTIGWYNPQFPYGILNVYQTPSSAVELHLFTDTILANLTVGQTFILPQGYSRAIKWCLAEELWPSLWGAAPLPASISKKASQSLNMIKALNAQPAQRAKYDRALVRGNRANAGWIMSGGYN